MGLIIFILAAGTAALCYRSRRKTFVAEQVEDQVARENEEANRVEVIPAVEEIVDDNKDEVAGEYASNPA